MSVSQVEPAHYAVLQADNEALRQRVTELEAQVQYLQQRVQQLRVFETLVEHAGEGVSVTDFAGNLLYVNPTLAWMSGYEAPSHLQGRHINQFFDTDDHIRIEQEIMPHILQQGTWQGYLWTLRADSSRYLMHTSSVLLTDEHDEPLALGGFARDITRQYETEQAVQQWAETFQHIKMGVAIGSADGITIEMVNPAFARMHGYTMEELAGQPVARLLAPEIRPYLHELVSLAYERDHYVYESVNMHSDGSTFPVLVDVTTVKDSAGQMLRRIVNVQDISERKQMEAALRRSHDELELRVAQRTAELLHTNEALQVEMLERRRAEAALRTSEQQFRAIFESAAMGIALGNTAGYVLESNAAFQRLSGYTADELQHMSFRQFTHPDDVVQEFALYEDMVTTGRDVYTIEKRYLRKDGATVWVHLTNSLIRDSSGMPQFGVGLVEDITQRKQAEQALAASEERYRTLVETSPDAILLTDASGCIQFANQRAAVVFDYAHVSDLVGVSLVELAAPYTGATGHDLMGMLASGDVRNLEQRMHRRDGSPVAVEISSSMLVHPQPAASTFIIVLRDISERKQSEQALTVAYQRQEVLNQNLTHSRNLLRALFDNLADGLVLLDGSGTVQIINKALATLLSSTPDDLDGCHWNDLYPRLFSDPSTDIPSPVSWYDGTHPEHIRYYFANDMTRIIDIHTIALREPDQADNQLIIHTTDVTERLRLQAQSIETERLSASGKLAASVAHEINTPLLSLDFSLEMAQIAPPDERYTFLSEAREEIQRIARIVRQLLDLYRPGEMQRGPVDMNTLLERMLLLTGKWVRDHGVVIERDLLPTLPRLYGRADELIQVLLNLVMNAVQAMPDGGMLHVQTASDGTTPARPAIIVTIRDTGVGMSRELQARIFEPFMTTREDGTGLGLAISKQIIEQHRGVITVASDPGLGSTFTIRLPT